MRVLFIPGNSPATVYTHAALATALQNSGHQVFVAGMDWILKDITSLGLPAMPISSMSEDDVVAFRETMPEEPDELARVVGEVYAQIAIDGLRPLLEMSQHWPPDVVVGGTMNYGAALLAEHLGVPSVRLGWDRSHSGPYDPGAQRILQPVLHERGLETLPEPDMWIDVCPPTLRPAGTTSRQPMRYIPRNPQCRLEPWMYARGERRRVCLTAGARVLEDGALGNLLKTLSEADVELVLPVPETVATELHAQFDDMRAGWIPLDVLAPTCDLIVHHGGGATDMTALHFGVPQLVVVQDVETGEMRRLAEHGAGITLYPDQQSPEHIRAACNEILTSPSYRNKAQSIAAEMATLPTPAEIVPQLEALASDPRKRGK